jgi:hypothetical protein
VLRTSGAEIALRRDGWTYTGWLQKAITNSCTYRTPPD